MARPAYALQPAAVAPPRPQPDECAPIRHQSTGERLLTLLIVGGPLVAMAVAVPVLWGRIVGPRDLGLALAMYVVTGFGVTVGFHRLLTHRGFRASRPLKIALAVAGSMAVEGSPTSWVANHRRHHMFSDTEGDPHSPHVDRAGTGPLGRFVYAHVGWLFSGSPTDPDRFAPDLLRDRDMVAISRHFPSLALASLALPFAAGWLLSGRTLIGGVTAFLWAGLVRMAVLHHITWSVNSVCHVFGRRPFPVKDRSGNVAALALVSFGESWHNFHHAFPACARHGALPGQRDPSAALIRLFERMGWASMVRWPDNQRNGPAVRGASAT